MLRLTLLLTFGANFDYVLTDTSANVAANVFVEIADLLDGSSDRKPRCGPNEVVSTCANIPDYAEWNKNLNRKIDPKICKPGCECAGGYVRDQNGVCVPEYKYPPYEPECEENEEYSDCPNNVCRPNSCDDLEYPLPCDQSPIKNTVCGKPGCICKSGYVKNNVGKCIPIKLCPKCNVNEEYSTCPNNVCRPKTCGEIGYPLPCYDLGKSVIDCGIPSCICQEGFAKNDDGVCVPWIECPSCGGDPNAQPGCGTFCKRCAKNVPCPKTCRLNGCDCREGYVYDDTKKICVLPKECPKCKENEEYYLNCPNDLYRPKTCDEVGYQLPRYKSDKNVIPSKKPCCLCQDGFVKNDDGVCIPTSECPSCGGDPNAQPGCGTFCNRCTKNVPCPRICHVNACDCRKEYVYDDTRKKCVLPKECRNQPIRKKCVPGTEWMNECNKCFCSKDGMAVCTEKFCEGVNVDVLGIVEVKTS